MWALALWDPVGPCGAVRALAKELAGRAAAAALRGVRRLDPNVSRFGLRRRRGGAALRRAGGCHRRTKWPGLGWSDPWMVRPMDGRPRTGPDGTHVTLYHMKTGLEKRSSSRNCANFSTSPFQLIFTNRLMKGEKINFRKEFLVFPSLQSFLPCATKCPPPKKNV